MSATSELDEIVNLAVLKLAGLSDPEFVDAMSSIVAAFEETVRRGAPQISDRDMVALREHFIVTVGQRLNMLGDNTGGPIGTA